MPSKKGNKLHSKGKMLPFSEREVPDAIGYAGAVADALRAEVARSGLTAKMLMRWTLASERTVKGWLSGQRGPSGDHLIALLRHSDSVFILVLQLSGRAAGSSPGDTVVVRRHLLDALAALNRIAGDEEGQVGT